MVRHPQRKRPEAAVSFLVLVFNEGKPQLRSFCTLNSSQNGRWECRNQGEKWECMGVGWKWADPYQSCREAIFHEQRPLAMSTLKEGMISFQMCHPLSVVSSCEPYQAFILFHFREARNMAINVKGKCHKCSPPTMCTGQPYPSHWGRCL